jgi:hypothetical protein
MIPMARAKKLCFLLALLASLLLGTLLLAVLRLGTESIGPGGQRLVGTWKDAAPGGGGTIIHSFQPDGTFVNRYYSDPGGTVLQDAVHGCWKVEDSTLIFWENQSRFTLGLKRLVGMGPSPERIPILSVTEQAITFGKRESPVICGRLGQ